ncbi:Beta-lactamase hydrolase-like protein [Ascidiaceihabitans donghaensis]|uniref:Beta-lactamase hydrolase-like protein n=1 Tax=Ascidiaceihabitans donghaensis TaxID=1510460 RepID=A0A2R8BG28_9RHOB|nr:TIGR01244 family sulfur transferase [Ascidiaceihabitans donghaensis]SPH21964.1 Beta-lactamase hydrolase-like protein [Ascidiaceihabitans donghaensis]
MDIREITPAYSVAPQIDLNDFPAIAAAGFKAVICNRPDPEIPPSHHAAEMQKAAHAAGLVFYNLPLTHHTMTAEVIAQHMAYAEENTPVLAYCASGTRCTVAWALGSAAKGVDISEILTKSSAAGYALDALRPSLEVAAAQS